MRLAGTLAALSILLVAGCNDARRIEQAEAVNDCARCHGFPPVSPHPQSTNCFVCHSTSVGPGNVIIPGGTHLNGNVDVTTHEIPYPPSVHGPAATAGIAACTECHGDDYNGGAAGVSCNTCHTAQLFPDWKTNCTFCHGTKTRGWTSASGLSLAAPPESVDGLGDQTSANPKVGAHQAHFAGTSSASPLSCGACHGSVPVFVFPGSLDHVTGTLAFVFDATATKGVTNANYAGAGGTCAVYCHGTGTEFVDPNTAASTRTSPPWTSTATLACDGCHGAPPATGLHAAAFHSFPCGRCHVRVAGIGATPSITDKTLHVNGQKNVDFSGSGTYNGGAHTCSNVACHGVNDTRPWFP